jgi:hypothetical protein
MAKRGKSEVKLYLLLISVVVFAFIVWNVALSETLILRSEYKEIQKELENSEDIGKNIGIMKSTLKQYSQLIGEIATDEFSHEQLLSEISKLCVRYNVRITEFPEVNIHDLSSDRIFTSKVVIEGTTFNLLKLLKQYETKGKSGSIVSTRFYSKTYRKTGKTTCILVMYIENVKHIEQNS